LKLNEIINVLILMVLIIICVALIINIIIVTSNEYDFSFLLYTEDELRDILTENNIKYDNITKTIIKVYNNEETIITLLKYSQMLDDEISELSKEVEDEDYDDLNSVLIEMKQKEYVRENVLHIVTDFLDKR
jgi:hypothetical protein